MHNAHSKKQLPQPKKEKCQVQRKPQPKKKGIKFKGMDQHVRNGGSEEGWLCAEYHSRFRPLAKGSVQSSFLPPLKSKSFCRNLFGCFSCIWFWHARSSCVNMNASIPTYVVIKCKLVTSPQLSSNQPIQSHPTEPTYPPQKKKKKHQSKSTPHSIQKHPPLTEKAQKKSIHFSPQTEARPATGKRPSRAFQPSGQVLSSHNGVPRIKKTIPKRSQHRALSKLVVKSVQKARVYLDLLKKSKKTQKHF